MKGNLPRLAVLGVFCLCVTTFAQPGTIRTGRFYRGTGTNTSFQSFAWPLDFQKGVVLDNLDGNATNLFPGINFGATRYHYNATNPASATNIALRTPFKNPIAAFGGRVGGSALYFNQEYRFGVYAGVTAPFSTNALFISVYRKSDSAFLGSVSVEIPALSDTNAWRSFLTNGYQKTVTAYGLTTTLRFDDPYVMWGVNYGAGCYHLTHTATQTGTNYVYVIILAGYNDGDWMVTDANGFGDWSRLYALEFEERPPWRALYLDQPHFSGESMPSFYHGKSLSELLTNAPPVTNSVSLAPSACTNLDASPELRRHPILDQFVTDLRRDPIALANYVQNEIELTDAIAYNDNGAITDTSINLAGVNRSALAAFQEKQGSPTEQCALLIYLLRQAGIPAAYVFPPENGMKMLDTQLSKLLRMQIRGAINNTEGANSLPYTTNSLIGVNYPWVAAYIGTNWVHLYPWLKDTQVVEGLNLYDYMPTNYTTSYQWIRDYLHNKTNITSLSAEGDTPQTLFPRFVKQVLATNAPGISLDDIGVHYVNRRHLYSRWIDFPRPPVVTNSSISIESLSSSAITNVYSGLTNIFDTVSVTVSSVANPSKTLASGSLRMVDLHNRRFLIRHEKITSTTHRMILSLEPYRSDATGIGNFSNDPNLLTQQSLTNSTLNSSDDALNVRIILNRHRSLPVGFVPPTHNIPYLGISEFTSITNNRPLRKGDLAAICLNVGRVTPQMLRVHAEALWNMERTLKADPSATNSLSADVYQGAVVYLMGMAYYEKAGRFDSLNQRLHKVQVESWYAAGLASIRAARTNNALPNGNIDLVQPSVDMFFQQVVIAGNTTVRLDSGDDGNVPNDDFFHLNVADGSAQEHAIINRYFRQTDAVSTMKLLQLAQAKSATNGQPGILVLDYFNYLSEGEKNYPTTGSIKLKNQSPSIWTSIANAFASYSSPDENFVQVFITPGPVTNQTGSFKGMGAWIIQPSGGTAAIAEKNGGYGANNPADSLGLGNSPNIGLGVDSENNYWINLTPVSSGNQVVSSGSTTWNQQQYYNALAGGQAYMDPALLLASAQANSLNGLFGGSQIEGYRWMNDLGNFGEPDWFDDSVAFLADPVNAVSGEFYVDTVDLSLPGPMPLQVRRNYSSHNLAENQFGFGWKMNYMPFLSVTTNGAVIYAAEPEGSVIAYEQNATNANLWLPNAARNPNLSNKGDGGIGGTANPFKSRIEKTTQSGTNIYTRYSADGGTRTFVERSYPIGSSFNRQRPYLSKWQDHRGNFYTFDYGEDATKPDYGEVRRVQSSNGSFLGFYYDVYGHIVEAYTGDGRHLFYEYDKYGDLVQVTFPDSSQISYEYQHSNFVTNSTTHVYSLHLITRENKPDGRVLVNEYDGQRRVTNQLATVGMDLVPVRNATFVYSNNFAFTNSVTNLVSGFTVIKDVFNNTNRYEYTNNLITRIIDALGQGEEQHWYADNAVAPGHPRSLWKTKNKRGLWAEFKYDPNGNVTNTVLTGDLTGDGITTQTATNRAAYNALNLPTEIVDAAGNKVVTQYHPQFTYLPEVVIRYANTTTVNTNKLAYYNVTNTFVSGGITYTNRALGLLQQEIRAFNSPDAATNLWAHDGRGFITQNVRFTGTGDPAITNTFFYNARGESVERADAAGRRTTFVYDAMGRPTQRDVFEAAQTKPLSWENSYYNENGELTWSDGPRFDPEDYIWRDYDGAGRLTTEIRWRTQAKTDGTGVEAPSGYDLFTQTFSEYDGFGNLKRTIDPRTAVVTNSWDALGRLVVRKFYDLGGTNLLSSEGFAYEPGGLVSCHTNALGGLTENQYTTTGQPKLRRNTDGSTNAWRYYLDGRVYREFQRNGAYWETTYDDANRKTTRIFRTSAAAALATNVSELDRRGNLVKRTDAGGNVFTNLFDGLDRLRISAGPAIVTVTTNPPPGGVVSNFYQQVSTTFYDAAGAVVTNANALGEKTVTWFDALGRPTRTEIRAANGTLVRESSTGYPQNHHSVTVTNGSGSGALVATTFTDNNGRSLLSIAYPYANVREFTLRDYDLAGNLAGEGRYAATNSSVAFFSGTVFEYDGLNRLRKQWDRDDALTTFAYNAAGNLTNRTMPGGLQWNATYNIAGQMLKEWNTGTGGAGTRTNTYLYFTSASPQAGLLATNVDGRGVICIHSYDDWLRPAATAYKGPLNDDDLTTTFSYDPRGMLTAIDDEFTEIVTPNSFLVGRSYDAYGQLTDEAAGVGLEYYEARQKWDVAGRRINLNLEGKDYAFGWRADGRLASVGLQEGIAAYNYTTAGVLTNRVVGNRNTKVTSQDGAGRPLATTTTVNLLTKLAEQLSWTGDGLLASHTLAREDFTNAAAYSYGAATRRLAEERLNLDATKRWTNVFTYDGGSGGGLGVLTKAGQPASALWSAGADSFSRVNNETNTAVRRSAYGRVNGPATVSVSLDGKPLPVNLNATGESPWFHQWRTTMELVSTGAHQLTVSAAHPSGQFITNTSVWFTNNAGGETVTDTFDPIGNLTYRVWKNFSGATNRTQTLAWDVKGRLFKVSERDASGSGYDWFPSYDPLGRRVLTRTFAVTNGVVVADPIPSRVSFFDPEVEFLELAVWLDYTHTTWKLYGPDLNGVYGGMNGVGGLEAVVPDSFTFSPTITDARGNVLAAATNGVVRWNKSRPTGYGAVPSYRPVPLGHGGDMVESSAWRGRRADITGLIWLGARYYNPEAGGFLSSDPVWNVRDPNYYTFCGGDPINYFDADGRWAKHNPVGVFVGGSFNDMANMGDRFIGGTIEAGAIGSDMIGQRAAALFGYGAEYQGYSQLYQNIYANPASGPTVSSILWGTGEAVANVGTLGLYGMGQGFGEGFATGDFSHAQDASLNSLLISGSIRLMQGSTLNTENNLAVSGRQWYDYFSQKYGAQNVDWVSGSGRTMTLPVGAPVPTADRMFRVPTPERSGTFANELASVAGPRPPGAVAHHVQFLQLNGVDNGRINGAWAPNVQHNQWHSVTTPFINSVPYGTEIVIKPPPP